MSIFPKICAFASALSLLALSACGFHLPNQAGLDEAVPKINVEGDYHHEFYKYVVQRLRVSGVEVNSEDSGSYAKDESVPTLMIAKPHVRNVVVAVDSRAQALERNILVQVAATLTIPGHRPIVMRNSLTRSVLNKAGRSLSSQNEINIVVSETYQILCDQMVSRIAYLGRQTDPTDPVPQPADLLVNEDDDFEVTSNMYEGMTLIDALQNRDARERAAGKSVSLSELNNYQRVMNGTKEGEEESEPKLPSVKPVLKHEAPHSLNTDL